MEGDVVVSVDTEAQEPTVRVQGELDLVTGPEVAQAVRELASAGHTAVVVDLTDVSFLDSSGLGQLIQAAQSVTTLTLLRPQPRVARVITLTGIADLFTIRD